MSLIKLSQLSYRLGMLNPRVEFFAILGWVLFFPNKDAHIYFLVFGLLTALFSFRHIYYMKTLSLSTFTYILGTFNLVVIVSIFFSNYRYKSILLAVDIILISLYFILLYFDKHDEDGYFRLLVYIISPVSLFNIINYVFAITGKKSIFFSNPIFQGVASGIAALICLFFIIKARQAKEPAKERRTQWMFWGLLILNIGGVYVSQSKAAFIGLALFSLLAVVAGKKHPGTQRQNSPQNIAGGKRYIPAAIIITLIILTFVIPNPIKDMFLFSLKKDPYSTNRLDIWDMSLTMFKEHPLTGVGLDNFTEVAGRYNFKQENGPANYFKVPARPHNDYLKIITETGIAGLLFLLLLFYALARRILYSPLFNLSKILVLYLLFQALLYNIIFHLFFFFIFLFLLKNLFLRDDRLFHKSFTREKKVYCVFLLIFVLAIGYIFPYYSNALIQRVINAPDIMTRFTLLKKAGNINPLQQDIYYLKAVTLFDFFKKTTNLEAFYSALENVNKARHLNPYFIRTYWLESDIYSHWMQERLKYPSLYEEIIAPLEQAEIYAPLNPFIKMRKAEIHLAFDHKQQAKQQALEALALEPDYVAALYFLQKNFNYFTTEEAFKKRIGIILEKSRRLDLKPYLLNLFKVPGK